MRESAALVRLPGLGRQLEGVGMADRLLFIGWGNPVRGMEERALESFNEAIGLLGRMQQEGRIESFDVALFNPNSDLDGYVSIKGTAEQIAGVREDEEFQRNTVTATLCVDRIRHIDGYANEGIAAQMALYQEAVAKVPQRA
jgi:hypothetical protein